ncbi:SDR family NAD(P)-dependent oxidoreductase [Corynebacterium simulans]|uniref:SDR family NAD(P)-dependent oxidoreductase n=1 Tax=Corynebacterium simulans TaxID=146827 RepID=UPI00200676E7|nr:SDR family NAD(P)-dependent oxidoreductase [Corynebacterium simulans]MCK6160057.1 SDR family NAD(P)-dependent oxidoreductase [Corynebacterium simulans]
MSHDPQTIVITGASDGIGAAAARVLHAQRPQDRLVLVGRNPEKTKAVAESVGASFHLADFESLGQVRRLAEELGELEEIHALGNNAGGIFDGPFTTADGFERTWQVNVVAPFLLTSLLREKLRKTDATIVQTASVANFLMSAFDPGDPNTFQKFTAERAYGNAKLGDILLTQYLHAHGMTSVAFHPGVLATNFARSSQTRTSKFYTGAISKYFGKAQAGGESLAYYLTGTPGMHFESGQYFNSKRKPGMRRPMAKKASVARRIFDDLGEQLGVDWN